MNTKSQGASGHGNGAIGAGSTVCDPGWLNIQPEVYVGHNSPR